MIALPPALGAAIVLAGVLAQATPAPTPGVSVTPGTDPTPVPPQAAEPSASGPPAQAARPESAASPANPPATSASAATAPSTGTVIELTSLRLLREKGIISPAEYDAAVRDVAATNGDRAADAATLVVGRWSTTLYGFLKADYAYDSTQSFSDVAGNALVERPGGAPPPPPYPPINYRGEHGRSTFSVRESRFGLLMRAPETHGIRVLAQLEADFLAPSAPVGAIVPAPGETRLPYEATESATFTQPGLRLRHANARIETPIVDVLFGQYWHLFGWQNVYQPGSVEIQGLPGQLYGRAPQLRISRAFRGEDASFEVAVAAVRPPARDSIMPDFQGGMRLAALRWTGVQTGGATSTSIMPASIAVTGDFRQFNLPEFDPLPTRTVTLATESVAVNAFVPILPAKERTGNALSVHGEAVYGSAIADLYTGLTGGMQMPAVANTTGLNPPPQYPQNIDNGLVVYDLDGSLHPVRWTTFLVGLQYTLPGLDGKVWLAANYSSQVSPNAADYTRPYAATLPDPQKAYYVSAAQVRKRMEFFDVSVFAEIVPSIRIGVEYAHFADHYVDGVDATNHRVQTAGIFVY